MSNRYEAAVRAGTAPTAGIPWVELRNGGTRTCYVEEIGGTLGAATASTIGILRATAQGSGGSATQAGLADDPREAASAGITLATHAFTVAPTLPTTYMRRFAIGAAVGAGFHWVWPSHSPLIVPASASLVIVAITAGAATSDWFCVWGEG